MNKTKATARAIVTLEIDVSGSWGNDCTVEQVFKQACDSALGRISNMVEGAKLKRGSVRLVTKPKIEAIVVQESR